jgi:BASS family bile acid:Na+ symporter
VLPFLSSRRLLHKKIYPSVLKIRGRLVDFGFALIIYTAVGLNRSVFFENFEILGLITFIFVISMFGLGSLHGFISKRLNTKKEIIVSQNLLLTVKSSGFTASTSMAIFGKEAAVPSAILAVLVLIYLLYLSVRNELKA